MPRSCRFSFVIHHIGRCMVAAVIGSLLVGCGESKKVSKPVVPAPKVTKSDGKKPPIVRTTPASEAAPHRKNPLFGDVPEERRSLGGLMDQAKKDAAFNNEKAAIGAEEHAKPRIDEQKGAAIGIRKISGRHLTLFTDLPADREIDEIPAVFDLAVPQWREYFGIDAARTEKWHLFGYVMKEKEKFENAGALSNDLPDFPHGYFAGREIWVYEQPSVYYRRHLVLHEGTHGFMSHFLGNYGPPWYAEGMAELLATHQWHEEKLTLRYMPKDRNEVPQWGRIKIIRDDFTGRRAKRLEDVMAYGPRDHYRPEPYAWCWAATTFLDQHPLTRDQFRKLQREATDFSAEFSQRFQQQLAADWRNISEEWQLYVSQLDYGMDILRMQVLRAPVVAIDADGANVKIATDRGWQSTGWRLEAGKTYTLSADGKFQIGNQPKTWWCEPGGVTIHYYQHLPLGMLVGAVCADDQPLQGLTSLATPQPIGRGLEFTPERSGTLYLRVNEFCGNLADNSGMLGVRIVPK